jgi:hypothetical protein
VQQLDNSNELEEAGEGEREAKVLEALKRREQELMRKMLETEAAKALAQYRKELRAVKA